MAPPVGRLCQLQILIIIIIVLTRLMQHVSEMEKSRHVHMLSLALLELTKGGTEGRVYIPDMEN